MSTSNSIEVRNISKAYKMYEKPHDRLKQSIFRGKKQFYREFWALKDVSFSIQKGRTVGIIGCNGSGKSTLLQILAGILEPTSGVKKVEGRIAALLELGSGFNPDFTGRENIYLNGAILGIGKEEMNHKMQSILDFAEIGSFVDQPVKTYSSGMFVRLAFSVAISVSPDILIIDEALAVGDSRFQLKCFERIKAIQKTGATVFLVSHDLQSIRQFCDEVLLFDKGRLLEQGEPNTIVNHYTKLLFSSERNELKEFELTKTPDSGTILNSEQQSEQIEYRYGNAKGFIDYFDIKTHLGQSQTIFNSGEKVIVQMHVRAEKFVEKPIYAMTIKTVKGLEVYGTNTYFQDNPFKSLSENKTVLVEFTQELNLIPGDYYFSFGFVELENEEIVPLDRRYDALEIKILPLGKDRSFGYANLHTQISVTPLDITGDE